MRLLACALLMAVLAMARSADAAPARVAVFSDPWFPYYDGAQALPPRTLAETLTRLGIEADVLDAGALADGDRFNAERYAALVQLCGR